MSSVCGGFYLQIPILRIFPSLIMFLWHILIQLLLNHMPLVWQIILNTR